MSFKTLAILIGFAALLITAAYAAGDYSLVYDQVGMDGGYSDTGDYQVIDMVKSTGIEGGAQESTDYAVTQTTGDTSEGTSGVDCWMLY